MFGNVFKAAFLDEGSQRCAIGCVVEIADDGNEACGLGSKAIDNAARGFRLKPAFPVRGILAAVTLALEVIGEHPNCFVSLGAHAVFRTVAAENRVAERGLVIDMALHPANFEVFPGHEPDIDAAVVIAVNEHDVFVRLAADGW